MLGNCEKMVVFSSTAKEWPQSQIDENSLMASTSKLMEKPGQEISQPTQQQQQQMQQQQQALKCPRCDSSNTKFCYYNNYCLSQPRHFCKACKRYWTRGGTLRNVPVGGGCRKNKRVKRPASGIEGATSVSTANLSPPSQPQLDISLTSNNFNTLFFGLPGNRCQVNLPFPSIFNSRVSSDVDTVSGYHDLQPQLNALALGFSSGIVSSDANGFNPTSKQIEDAVTSNSLLSSYSIFGSSSSTPTASPTMATLLASGFHQQKYTNGSCKESRTPDQFYALTSFEDMLMSGNNDSGSALKEVKSEYGQSRLEWNVPCQNQIEQIGFSDPPVYWNSSTSVGAWHDPANIGSSVTSLI